jgi:hypothetical protein
VPTSSLHFAFGVGEHLAVFSGNEGGEIVDVVLGDTQKSAKDARAAQRGGFRPALRRLYSGRDRLVDIGGGRQMHGSGLLAGRRVENR